MSGLIHVFSTSSKKPLVFSCFLEYLTNILTILVVGFDAYEHIFQSGVYLFLNGDYYEALHIFAPQIENVFRNIARQAGGLTVTLEEDGSSMEKVLSSIFFIARIIRLL